MTYLTTSLLKLLKAAKQKKGSKHVGDGDAQVQLTFTKFSLNDRINVDNP